MTTCIIGIAHTVGFLHAVGSLTLSARNSTLSLTWTPPFTLDITGVDPDIEGYCIDITSSTSSFTLYSDCGINISMTEFLIPRDCGCHNYSFAVTPVNVVGNGTSERRLYSCSQECKKVYIKNEFMLCFISAPQLMRKISVNQIFPTLTYLIAMVKYYAHNDCFIIIAVHV